MKVIKNYENMNIMEDYIIIIIIIILNISNITISISMYLYHLYINNLIILSILICIYLVKFVGITPKKEEKKKGI
jgi:hypothetical protein